MIFFKSSFHFLTFRRRRDLTRRGQQLSWRRGAGQLKIQIYTNEYPNIIVKKLHKRATETVDKLKQGCFRESRQHDPWIFLWLRSHSLISVQRGLRWNLFLLKSQPNNLRKEYLCKNLRNLNNPTLFEAKHRRALNWCVTGFHEPEEM